MTATHRAICEQELLRHLGWVRGLALRLVGDMTRADDLTQEVCRAALESPPREVLLGSGLRAWLRSVARFLARDILRGEKRLASREARASRVAATPSTFDVVARNALVQQVSHAVMALPEPYRSTVLYRYLDGLRPAEIALQTKVACATVRTRLSRGLEMLRPLLARQGIDGSVLGALFVLPANGGVVTAKVSTVGGVAIMASKVKAVTGLAVLGGAGVLYSVFSPPMHGALPEPDAAAPALSVATGPQQATAGPREPVINLRGQEPVRRTPLPPPPAKEPEPAPASPSMLAFSPDGVKVLYGRLDPDTGEFERMARLYEEAKRGLAASQVTLPDGFHMEPYESGALSAAGMIRNGTRVDAWSEWHEDGTQKAQGEYVHGERHGPWTFWSPDGQIVSAGQYLYGMKEGEWVDRGEGGERSTATYRGGKKYGVERIWNPDGSVKSETTWYADVAVK